MNKRVDEFIKLVSNTMEAYTAGLFLRDDQDENCLTLNNFHSLSKYVKKNCRICSGEGIIGWVFREQKSVLASPFDKRDATTLKFYAKDEKIKSLLAIPLPENKGVLCVDSKKSYFFTDEREKILRQMSFILIDIVGAQKEIEQKATLENLLKLSLNIDEILIGSQTKSELLSNFFSVLRERLNVYLIVFSVEGSYIYYSVKSEGYVIENEFPHNFLDEHGFIGWIFKNKKELFLEKIRKTDKSYIVNRKDIFENFSNFFGIPLSVADSSDNKQNAVMAFVKYQNEKWHSKEKKTLTVISHLFFKEWLHKIIQ